MILPQGPYIMTTYIELTELVEYTLEETLQNFWLTLSKILQGDSYYLGFWVKPNYKNDAINLSFKNDAINLIVGHSNVSQSEAANLLQAIWLQNNESGTWYEWVDDNNVYSTHPDFEDFDRDFVSVLDVLREHLKHYNESLRSRSYSPHPMHEAFMKILYN